MRPGLDRSGTLVVAAVEAVDLGTVVAVAEAEVEVEVVEALVGRDLQTWTETKLTHAKYGFRATGDTIFSVTCEHTQQIDVTVL
jgi:hypothetical protein